MMFMKSVTPATVLKELSDFQSFVFLYKEWPHNDTLLRVKGDRDNRQKPGLPYLPATVRCLDGSPIRKHQVLLLLLSLAHLQLEP